jgi:hypothetical protein
MTTEVRLTVRLDPDVGIRAKLKAKDMKLTTAEYVRALIEKDLKKGAVAEVLAELNTETTLISAMMVRELATYFFGVDKGKDLEKWATGRAAERLRNEFLEKNPIYDPS